MQEDIWHNRLHKCLDILLTINIGNAPCHTNLPHTFMCIWYLIQCHPVEFNGFVVLTHFVVNVAHIYSQSARVIKHSVLGNDLVGVEGFCIHVIGCILIGQIE